MYRLETKDDIAISIIVAVYNGAKTLEDCIESFIQQNYPNKSLIIIDGKSSDNTLKIINKYKEHISYWVSEPDEGIYDAWNKGLKQTKSDWVGFIGADDILMPNALEKYAYFITKNQSLEYVSSRVTLANGRKKIRTIGKPWQWSKFKRYMNVAHVGSMHNVNLYKKYGFYDTSYRICADYEFLLRAKENLNAGFLNYVTTTMNVGGLSDGKNALIETKRAKISTGERNRIIAELEYIFSVFKLWIRKLVWY